MPESQDVPRPNWGPAFLPLGSWPYRVEYGVATIAILAVVFGWRMVVLRDFPVEDVLFFVLWFLLPDIVAFVPIGLSRSPSGSWPTWGAPIYNLMHSLLIWAALLFMLLLVTGGIQWPLLGWAAHITMDRTTGYHLRARSTAGTRSPA